jgi:molybdopterin synthase sulfur carrier subunit
MPVVWVPSQMRDLTGGAVEVRVPGRTIRQVIANLERAYPGVAARLLDEGDLNPSIAVVVDGETATLGLLEPVQEESEVHFVPAIGGGAA